MIPAEITKDLRAGMGLEECLIKHNTNFQSLFTERPYNKTKERRTVTEKWMYIFPQRSGNYSVIYRSYRYGTYHSFEDAERVRDEMMKRNWDRTQLKKVLDELNIELTKGSRGNLCIK